MSTPLFDRNPHPHGANVNAWGCPGKVPKGTFGRAMRFLPARSGMLLETAVTIFGEAGQITKGG
jgi:hypothetical protein